ncbi:methyl-accepting chemotaxis protein [Aquabacterium sp. A7-Y]|uniref:methyl-accepting chemotaxis protein n=1 Tax=Aquabacterium sp. A7-Y TaxID=1349605 RepID=UPI002AC87013|nr:methyl-accepting chemotaxis protein [Aquabacterium sp. A7-Y]
MDFIARFNRTRISTRLAVALGLLMALMVGISGYSVKKLFDTTSVLDRLAKQEWKLMQETGAWKALVELNVFRVATHSRLGTGEYPDLLMKDYQAAVTQIEKRQKVIAAALVTEEMRSQYQQVDQLRKQIEAMQPRIKEFRDQGDYVALEGLLNGDFEKARVAYLGGIDKLQSLALHRAETASAQAQSETRTAAFITLLLVAASLGFATVFGWWMSGSISRPIRGVVAQARAIAGGDLSHALEVNTGGEAGELQQALVDMQEALRAMVSQVRTATDSISTASSEIASGNQDLSARTEQAASNLQQTASSMEQLTDTVNHSAESAQQASQLASSASSAAQRGGAVVSRVVATMDDITTASKKIADIIGVIDAIAFQTNILALNAAVESARAGEHGRGFAVVAAEVRNLAQRSAQAAKEIKTLIGTSVEKVEGGTRLVADAGTTMNEIVAAVQRVTDMIGDIAASAREQSSGIGQVNTAVSQLDHMTQQNAALVEESAAAAQSLKDQAQRLASVVAQFRLDAADPALV